MHLLSADLDWFAISAGGKSKKRYSFLLSTSPQVRKRKKNSLEKICVMRDENHDVAFGGFAYDGRTGGRRK